MPYVPAMFSASLRDPSGPTAGLPLWFFQVAYVPNRKEFSDISSPPRLFSSARPPALHSARPLRAAAIPPPTRRRHPAPLRPSCRPRRAPFLATPPHLLSSEL
ncbi:hypothetical protein PYCCODRAFT_87303 [Trametes coccinea BRFM310]|uniref:Uncharacterized protein n=1 Tax=Trametes coccinea (strain BRFM310) TaxID=1353009 RepID=A0A1Y2I5G9_TRAC3|nr:hypothetical protein PYCCODRAFT_87303 [Trametes coccinea BRFM310]